MESKSCILGAVLATLVTGAAPIPEKKSGPPTMSSIATRMDGVTASLSKTVTGQPVQKSQKVVLRDLDELIAALEKECQGCRGSIAKNRPRSPAAGPHGGTGGVGDLVDPAQSEKDWTKLDPRERDRILQSMSEGFPPEYRTVLERYYRRLAEEKSAAKGVEDTKPDAPETP